MKIFLAILAVMALVAIWAGFGAVKDARDDSPERKEN